MRKLNAAGLALLSMLVFFAKPIQAAAFSDLSDPLEQASAAILAKYQIMPSLGPSEFGASNPLTRFDLADILDNLLDPRDIPFQVISFTDVPPGHRSAKAVNKVVCFDILKANGGMFGGNARVTRLSLVEALDRLLTYRSTLPPPRRKSVFFPDVKKSVLLDRGANFWQFLDNPEYIRFRPYELVTRAEAAVIVARVAALLDPAISADLKKSLIQVSETPDETPSPLPTPVTPASAKPTPEPQPSVKPSDGPPPWLVSTPSPTPVETATPIEASISPTPNPSPIPSQKWGNGFTFDPLSVLLIADNESSASQSGNGGLSTLHLDGSYGFGSIIGFLDINTTIMPGSLGGTNKSTSMSPDASYSNIMIHIAGLYRLPWRGADWESAGGLGTIFRLTLADSTGICLGLGPAGMVTYRPQPALSLTGGLQLHPLLFSGSGLGFGINPSIEGEYQLMPLLSGQMSLHFGLNEQLDVGFSGGTSSLTALYGGLGMSF